MSKEGIWMGVGVALATILLILAVVFNLSANNQTETTNNDTGRVLQKGQPDSVNGGYVGSGFSYLVVGRDYPQPSAPLPNQNQGLSYDVLVRDNPTQQQLDNTFAKDYVVSFDDFTYDQLFRLQYLKRITVYDSYDLRGNNQPLQVYDYQIPPAMAPEEPLESLEPGYWRIGEDLRPGTYQITAAEGVSPWPSQTPSHPVTYNPVDGFGYQKTPAAEPAGQQTAYCSLIYYSNQPSQPPAPIEESGLKLNERQLDDGTFAGRLDISVFKGDTVAISLGSPLLAVAAPNPENGFYCGPSWSRLD